MPDQRRGESRTLVSGRRSRPNRNQARWELSAPESGLLCPTENPLRLPDLRQRAAEVAGQMPRLRRVEHPGRDHRAGTRPGAVPRRSLPFRRARLALPDIPADGYERIPVPIGELSRVLGGGIVPGSVVLISGDTGIGRLTLLIQLCAALSRGRRPFAAPVLLYVSGEESAASSNCRAERLGIVSPHILVLADTHLESIAAHIEKTQPRWSS